MRETKGKQLEKQVLGGLRGSDAIRNRIHLDRGPFAKTATPEALPSTPKENNFGKSRIKSDPRHIGDIGSDRLPTGGAVGANGPRSPGPTHSTPGPNGAGIERAEGRDWLVNNSLTHRKGRLKSVVACESGAWTIASWKVKKPSRKHFRKFKCRSWRHEGECRKRAGALDFMRCKEGIESRDGWIYVVLTYDPKQWSGKWEAFKQGGKMWNRLRSRLNRKYGKVEYIQTWEAHQSGWPHVNLIMHNLEMLRICGPQGSKSWRKFRKELNKMAVEVGFGKRIWVEPMRNGEEMAGYITKLGGKLSALPEEMTGAMAKDQTPVDAPRHFRRIRASRGLLPAKFSHEGVWTGRMIQKSVEEIRKIEREWGLDVEALANPHLWTLIRSLDDGELIEEIEVEVEILENIIHEKFDAEVRAG